VLESKPLLGAVLQAGQVDGAEGSWKEYAPTINSEDSLLNQTENYVKKF